MSCACHNHDLKRRAYLHPHETVCAHVLVYSKEELIEKQWQQNKTLFQEM